MMLSSLRDASKGWVSKILLLLLVLSFAVWGISDQIGGAGQRGAVLTAGEIKVSPTEYRLAYNRQLSIIQQRLGQRLTPEQARLFGLENQVVGSLVGGAVLDEQARQMQLGLSEDRLAGLIGEDQAFQGLSGQFDRSQFRRVLANVGMTEADYIAYTEKAAQRQQIVEAISDGMEVPSTFMTALAQFQGQTRDINFIEIDESTLPEITPPDETALSAYFEDNKSNYRAPEYRAVKIVRLTTDEIADPSTIEEAAVREEYENNLTRYTTQETRTVQQLVFPDAEAANAALERIRSGGSFEEEVTASGRTLEDVTLGTFRKSEVPDPNVAEAAFGLETTDSISEVIDGVFGSVLARVSAITPETVQPFDEVKDTIRTELAQLEAQDLILNVHDAYEDARAAGSTLDEAAASQKLPVREIAMIDRQGLDENGNDIDLGNEENELISAIFEADIELENTPIAAGRDGFIWYEVTNVIADRDRTLEEVRERVIEDWILSEKNRLLDEEAERLAGELRNGKSATELVEGTDYRSAQKFGLARDANDPDFGQSGVREVFSVGPNGVSFASAPNGIRRLVFQVTAINNPLGGEDNIPEAQAENVALSLRGDMLDLMVNRLQTEIPISINQAAMQQAITPQGGR